MFTWKHLKSFFDYLRIIKLEIWHSLSTEIFNVIMRLELNTRQQPNFQGSFSPKTQIEL